MHNYCVRMLFASYFIHFFTHIIIIIIISYYHSSLDILLYVKQGIDLQNNHSIGNSMYIDITDT